MEGEKPNLPVLYTVREVAQAAKQTEVTIRRHVQKGAISYVKVGGSVRFRLSDVCEYLGVKKSDLISG